MEICHGQSEQILRIFSEVTVLVKFWARKRGIYNFNLGYLNGISLMVMVARAIFDFFSGDFQARQLLDRDHCRARQDILEHFFSLFADWNWNGESFEQRSIYLVHPEAYLMDHGETLDANIRENCESACSMAMATNMPILSP